MKPALVKFWAAWCMAVIGFGAYWAQGAFTSHLYDGDMNYAYGYNPERVWQAYSATVERAWAGYSTNNVMWNTSVIFGAVSELHGFKQDLKSNLEDNYWADWHRATGGTFNGWFSDTNNVDFPRLTVSNICTYAGVPTNWFDATDWFGAVNSTNGWMYFDDVVTQMVWTVIADPMHETMGCDTNPSWLYWMGDGTNNPTITTNAPPSSDLVRITNSVVAPKQWWQTVTETNYVYGYVTNVWDQQAVDYEQWGYGYTCAGGLIGYGYLDYITFVDYWDCTNNLEVTAEDQRNDAEESLPLFYCNQYGFDYVVIAETKSPSVVYSLTTTTICEVAIATNILYSIESEYILSDITFENIAAIESDKIPYFKFSIPDGNQPIFTNILLGALETNVYISATNAIYTNSTCCGFDVTFTNPIGYELVYATNVYHPTNITFGSVMPSPYTNTIFKEWTASAETSTNIKFCDDTFTTDLLPEPTYNGTNYTAYGFELEDAKLLIKWQFDYGTTNSP